MFTGLRFWLAGLGLAGHWAEVTPGRGRPFGHGSPVAGPEAIDALSARFVGGAAVYTLGHGGGLAGEWPDWPSRPSLTAVETPGERGGKGESILRLTGRGKGVGVVGGVLPCERLG